MRKAQSTLADFLKVAAAPRPCTQGFSLKVAVREGERVEYFWITPFTNTQFSGEINNTPRVVHSVKLGQTITFAQSDIVRLALYRERDDARQLHCLRAPHIGAEKRSGRVQKNLRAQLRFMKTDFAIH